MKSKIFIFLAISILFSNCNDAEKIFKGELYVVKKPSIDKLIGEKVYLDGLYAGIPVVFDTIISFVHSYGDYYVANFDINTGKHIGNFFTRGQGPGEYTNIGLLHSESRYDYWIDELNKRHYILADMSSGKEKKRIDFSDFKKTGNLPFIRAFILNDSLLIAVNQPEMKNDEGDIIVPKFSVVNYLKKEEVGSFELYDEDLYNKMRAHADNNTHLLAAYRIKPDKSKIAAVMTRMYQVNILDLETGEWKGFRLGNNHGFDFVRVPLPVENRSYRSYYRVSVDDVFIYAMLDNLFNPDVKPVIHVFDWNGNFVRILELDKKGVAFDLNKLQKKLYLKSVDENENVWVYDVSYLYK